MCIKKNRLDRKYISGGRKDIDEVKLIEATNFVSDLITTSKESYLTNIGEKLNDPNTSPKTYWSLLKRFLNKVKIPEIPPLIINNVFVTDFIAKGNLFKIFFNNQCSTLENGSVIPEFNYKTNERVTNIQFSSSDILKITRSRGL